MDSSDTKSQYPSKAGAINRAPPSKSTPQVQGLTIAQVKALLLVTNPFCNIEKQDQVFRAVYHVTNGSDDGLALMDTWYSKGDNYPGPEEMANRWQSYKGNTDTPVTIDIVCEMVEADGFDWIDICSNTDPDFEPCEPIIVHPDEQAPVTTPAPENPLDKFSLKGMHSQLLQDAVKQVFALEPLALTGQATVLFSPPNTGKTLITLRLAADAVSQGNIDPTKLYYFNADDSFTGALDKLEFADEIGHHTIVDGQKGFSTDDFLEILASLTASNQTTGIIVILDTAKKFVDVMNKRKSRSFGKHIRLFVMKGGTCICLAHTNKNRNSDGKPIYAGTSDIVEDFDCAYLMYEVGVDIDAETKTILLENIKNRGHVAKQASYRYSIAEGLSYREILESIEPVDETELSSLKQSEELKSDAEVIDAVMACIQDGINTKIKLAEAVAERSGISRRAANKIIEKYAGTDPAIHKWTYTVRDRGAKVFSLLVTDTADSDLVGTP